MIHHDLIWENETLILPMSFKPTLMTKLHLLSLFGLLPLYACTPTAKSDVDLSSIISRGDIVVDVYEPQQETGCYLANGRFGAVMSALGLNLSPQEQAQQPNVGHSQFSHLNHWGRFGFTSAIEKQSTVADYLMPMFKLYWEQQPDTVTSYRQVHHMYDGYLSTDFTTQEADVSVKTWFDMVEKDLAGVEIELSEGTMPVRATVCSNFQVYPFVFRDNVEQTVEVQPTDDAWCVTIACPSSLNGLSSQLYFYSTAPVEVCSDGLRFLVSQGHNQIFISYGGPASTLKREQSLQQSQQAWHTEWSQSGWMDYPDFHAQQMWVHSMAYMLSTYDDFQLGLFQPTNGFTCNPFPFHYVQDLEYIAPAMMMTGHNDIIMRWVEKFSSEIPQHQAYAKHLWPQTEGIYPPWELPFGSVEGYHEPFVPVAFCYEPHNVGYLARLAVEAGQFSGDSVWINQHVKPLIRQCADFYQSACQRQADGYWHMSWYPCIGQDEAGGRNKSDYLCSIYSAQYTFQSAISLGLDTDGTLAAILRDGLAYPSLMSERGIYHTCQGADDFGKQKHPVQLDGLSYFPNQSQPTQPEVDAYRLRHDITDRARDPHFFGWTLGQFLLSGSNMKDPEGWLKDWALLRPSNYTDSHWKQLYETSGNRGAAFYVTTHGMLLQSLIRNYVNDYWGELDIAGCPVFTSGPVRFGNISTRFGVTLSGCVDGSKAEVTLHAHRDTSFPFQGKPLHLNAGEERTISIDVSSTP